MYFLRIDLPWILNIGSKLGNVGSNAWDLKQKIQEFESLCNQNSDAVHPEYCTEKYHHYSG